MADEEEGMAKHRDMEGKGKGDGHQHGLQPMIPEPAQYPRNLPSEGHWAPTGAETMDQWMDGITN